MESRLSFNYITFNYTSIGYNTEKINFPSIGNRIWLNDAPYDIFCIPYPVYDDPTAIISNNVSAVKLDIANKEQALSIAQSIAEEMG